MLKRLENSTNYKLHSNNGIIKFNYDEYIFACKLIASSIKSNYDLDDIEIIGLARGGLPMLVTLSHLLGIRKVSMIQTQMSNSDNCHDYGELRYISDNLDLNKKNCILFEDIIYKGKTTNGVIEVLKNKGKNVLAVYSLIIDENFKNLKGKNDIIPINYVYEIPKDDWVYFFWEVDLKEVI